MSAEETTISRRQILKGAAVAGAAGALGPFFPGRVLGANDRVNVAIVGVRNQGTAHIENFSRVPNVRIKTLCDLDENLFASRIKSVQEKTGSAPEAVWDLRRVLDDKDVDAVSFAVPNFWHALATIWACQAKKNVYVEKPACHTIWEGRQMVNAARKYGTVVQVGFQNRSRPNTRAAIEFLHGGRLGKIYRVRGLCFKGRGNIGRYPDGPMPDGSTFHMTVDDKGAPGYTASYLQKVHYDTWLGPTPARPFNPNRFHYNWHWQWEYGNGDTGNQGPHQFDVGHWGLNKGNEHPVKLSSFGGYYLYDSQQETPNEQTSVLEYADGTIFEFATRGFPTNSEGGIKIGNIFYGSEGRLEIDSEGAWKTYLGSKGEPGPDSSGIQAEKSNAVDKAGTGMLDHFQNFVNAVRSGKPQELNCEVEVGYRTSSLPLLANIAYRLKRPLKWDGKHEQFVGDAEANRMLKRNDRKGYVVPKLGPVGLG